jgi:pimeloyl-ACP methyl ester carboxylesterase
VIVEERNIDIGGLSTHYLMAGEGPPLVLLHALGESAFDWRWVLPTLAHTHRVYAPDMPGFGHSAKPSAGSFRYFLKDLRSSPARPGRSRS